MRVLVADDSSTMLRIITNTLRRIGIEDFETAEDGHVAFRLYSMGLDNDSPFDMILTDWNMPVMNGLELVKKIRSVDKDIPIVMITTEGGKAEVITALRAGVNNYIVKPFTPQILRDKLEEIIGKKL